MNASAPKRHALWPWVVGLTAGLAVRLALWAFLHWPVLGGGQSGRTLLVQLGGLAAGAWAGEWLGARVAEDGLPGELHFVLSSAFAALGAVAALLVQAMVLDIRP